MKLNVKNGVPLVIAGFAVLSGLTLAVVSLNIWLLNPPAKDLVLLGIFLFSSGGITLLLGHGIMYFGTAGFLRSIRARLLLVLLMSAALALVNVGFTARLMFISSHDLALLAFLLLFSLGMSGFIALATSISISSNLASLLSAIRRAGAGDFTQRVNVSGRDEISEVGVAVNKMAQQLEDAASKQRTLEHSRRQLIAAVSHDLRTPLASMRAMVESINDGVVSDSDTVNRYLRNLQNEVEYLSTLIDDLFEVSQIDAGLLQLHLERGSVQELISDTMESMSAQAKKKGLKLSGKADETLTPVIMDTRHIQRVLYNLIQNALRFTPADGTIFIQATDAGKEVQISVADTGEGILPDQLPNLFERFHKIDKARSRNGGGSGIGLSIARGLVEAHGGRIWAESKQGHGATFTFTIPKAQI